MTSLIVFSFFFVVIYDGSLTPSYRDIAETVTKSEYDSAFLSPRPVCGIFAASNSKKRLFFSNSSNVKLFLLLDLTFFFHQL